MRVRERASTLLLQSSYTHSSSYTRPSSVPTPSIHTHTHIHVPQMPHTCASHMLCLLHPTHLLARRSLVQRSSCMARLQPTPTRRVAHRDGGVGLGGYPDRLYMPVIRGRQTESHRSRRGRGARAVCDTSGLTRGRLSCPHIVAGWCGGLNPPFTANPVFGFVCSPWYRTYRLYCTVHTHTFTQRKRFLFGIRILEWCVFVEYICEAVSLQHTYVYKRLQHYCLHSYVRFVTHVITRRPMLLCLSVFPRRLLPKGLCQG